jgi:hypothetical protein
LIPKFFELLKGENVARLDLGVSDDPIVAKNIEDHRKLPGLRIYYRKHLTHVSCKICLNKLFFFTWTKSRRKW